MTLEKESGRESESEKERKRGDSFVLSESEQANSNEFNQIAKKKEHQFYNSTRNSFRTDCYVASPFNYI